MLRDSVKQLRVEKGLTQKQLADKLGIAQSTIGMIERGERGASNDLLLKLSSFFNVSIDFLLSPEERLDMALGTIVKIKELTTEGIDECRIDLSNSIYSIFTRFDKEKFSEEEKDEIINFIEFVLSKRKK